MFEAQLLAGGGKEPGAIRGTAVGEDGLDGDAVGAVKSQSLLESGQDAGDFFVGQEGGESQAGMIIDGDVERLHTRARVAMGAVAGGADAGLGEAAKLFNIKMQELAWERAFVAEDGRPGRVQGSQTIKSVALEDAGEGSF
jgi:hypothetical protein